MSAKSGGTVIGYKCYLGVHMVPCYGPIDKILKFIADTDKILYEGSFTGGDLYIDKPEAFGGDDMEGGFKGTVSFDFGAPTQVQNTYLQSVLGVDIPAFRGVLSIILNKCYVGKHFYLKPLDILATRIHVTEQGATQWQNSLAEPIPHCMNPIHIIREVLLSDTFGKNVSTAEIDDANFIAAATTIYNEGIGLSFLWNDNTLADDFINDVLGHIDAHLYRDIITGKYNIKLIRKDYVLGDLVHLNEDHIKTVSEYIPQTLSNLVNQVEVKFWNEEKLKDDSITIKDLSLIQRQGRISSKSVTYTGVTKASLAMKFAQRDLRQYSQNLASIRFTCDTTAKYLNEGSAFRFSYAEMGIVDDVYRVVDISLGTTTNSAIQISAIRDIFDNEAEVILAPPVSGWIDPITDPVNSSFVALEEVPYQMYAMWYGDVKAQAVPATTNYAFMYGERPSSDAFSAQIWEHIGTESYTKLGTMYFCPTAKTTGAITLTQTVIPISQIVDWEDVELGMLIQFDSELMHITSLSNTSITVARGVVDTLPTTHAALTKGYVWTNYNGTIQDEFLLGDIVKAKALTVTGKGVLPLGSATEKSLTIGERFHRPYPPGNFKINSVAYATAVTGIITVTWSHRNRLTQTAGYYGQTSGDITPEVGTTYNLNLYEDVTIIETATGVTTNTYTFNTSSNRTALLLHFNGANNSTTFTDSSGNSLTPSSVMGNAKLTTTTPLFGTAAGIFDGAGDYLIYSGTATVLKLIKDFTIECFVRISAQPAAGVPYQIVAKGSTAASTSGYGFAYWYSGTGVIYQLVLFLSSNGTTAITFTLDATIPLNTYTHIYASRLGDNLYIGINGTGTLVGTFTGDIFTSTANLHVGASLTPASYFNGRMEELRINRSCIYTSGAYTVPAAELAPILTPLGSNLSVELEAVRGGLTSYQKYNHSFTYS